MNTRLIKNTLGRILLVEGGLLILPLLVSIYFREDLKIGLSFLAAIAISLVFYFGLNFKKAKDKSLYSKEGYVIVALSWLLISLVGSLPFVISGTIPSLIDAFFEISSGFTTTGASILTDVEALPRSMLWWRSFTHLIGGMGVLVLVLALLPNIGSDSVHVMKAEVPGPSFGKLRSRVSHSARTLYIIYLVMTAFVIGFLYLGGIGLFDSTLLAFGAAGTGGFALLNGSIAPYNNLYVEIVLTIAMLVFGVNFNLYYFFLQKDFKAFFKSEELKLYLFIVFMSIGLISLNLVTKGMALSQALRGSSFSVASIISTTGYSTADFGTWPLFSQSIILFLMFTGAMAGSTAGGLKMARIGVLIRAAKAQFKKVFSPNSYVSVNYEGKPIERSYLLSVLGYLLIYILIFAFGVFVVSLEAEDFTTAFSTIAATFNNIGPGLGAVGPSASYASYSQPMKLFLSIIMITGRLEIYPMLMLLNPRTYRN